MSDATKAAKDTRTCTCHPDDNPPVPCPRKFALTECRNADLAARLRDRAASMEDSDGMASDTSKLLYEAATALVDVTPETT